MFSLSMPVWLVKWAKPMDCDRIPLDRGCSAGIARKVTGLACEWLDCTKFIPKSCNFGEFHQMPMASSGSSVELLLGDLVNNNSNNQNTFGFAVVV